MQLLYSLNIIEVYMNKFDELRKKHPLFIYHSYELNEHNLTFHFQMDEYHFYPKWEFDKNYLNGNFSRNG